MDGIRGWVFDLDGTLTIAQHDFPAIRRELGIPANDDILTYIAALPEPGRSDLSARLDAIEHRLAEAVQPALGAAQLIRFLRDRGDRLGILTRNLRSVAFSSLRALGVADCFNEEDVLGRKDALPKPDPDGILQLTQRWQLNRAEVVMVGDFRFDLEAGRAAGCRTCLILPQNSWPDLADWHMPDCRSVLNSLSPGLGSDRTAG
ncbi:haloacid dehalogenase superfamily, subfamily IA, variant 3 with third motif having DD or ED [Halopseudomonas xinjiangensis]|uniref:Haloacid dehalogenase superfamily, subfamily IA, variant 3 with third motif having DD or ED n=1 Tax=Halopseudomonas xinjiangensis TaxID=487184 RepID=A0A1H1UU89_9GAMM|nr:HAD family hydrolase [Halopseudomonas xinjiangensis]SDS76067.1 haloacid dehalogenase superfamily, subfamily IA, variant 3 with third motif having DD or ED [Halopseudomonas xinjiangensis]